MSNAFSDERRPVLQRGRGDANLRVGFCVSGGGNLFRAAVENAAALAIQPSYVLLDRNASPEVEEFARARGIAFHRLVSPRRPELDTEITARFEAADTELWALTFDKILPAEVVTPRLGRIVNVHMALLPAFAGMHGIRQTIAGGARFGGATLHEVDEQMDHGPIVAQCGISMLPGDDEVSAGARIWPLLRATYLQVLAWYGAGRVVRGCDGRLWVDGADYAAWPISPALELPVTVTGLG